MELNIKEMKKVEFEDIKVGEIFGVDGCFRIYYKDSETTAILLAIDYATNSEKGIPYGLSKPVKKEFTYEKSLWEVGYIESFYKMPEKYQELFLGE